METAKVNREHSKRKTLGIILLATIMSILVILGVDLWLGSQQCVCPNPDLIGVYSVTLGSNGWVTFNMTGAYDPNFYFVIHTVKAYNTSNIDSSTPPIGSVYPSSNNVLPPRGKLILSVQFQGVVWQPGVRYTFTILNYQGYGINVYQCLNGC